MISSIRTATGSSPRCPSRIGVPSGFGQGADVRTHTVNGTQCTFSGQLDGQIEVTDDDGAEPGQIGLEAKFAC